ncbi:MAG: hypothetical protein ACXVEF_32720 [Polyangiales bacterium]
MHIRSILLVAALSTAACASRQAVVASPPASTAPQVAMGGTVQPGTRLVATLDTPIGTEFSKVGDSFYATLQTPVVDDRGYPVIPAGSKIVGSVVDLRETRGGDPAVVSLEVEAIQIGTVTRPFSGRIVETEVESTGRHVSGRAIGGGAAGGAILGAILGGGSGALKGAAIGAGAGTLISLGTSKTGAKLPSGTTLAVETTQPMQPQ